MLRKFPKIYWAIAAVAIMLALLLGARWKSESKTTRGKNETVTAVVTESVRQEEVRRAAEVIGTLAALDQVTVSSEVDGVVRGIEADLGDHVRAGQVMVELNREKLQYNYEQQKAAFASALAKYGAADTAHLPPAEQIPDVMKASAELLQARQAYDRIAELEKRGVLAKQQLDDSQANLHAKQAAYDSALQNVKNMRASIDASEASMNLADREVRDASIRAPFDGYIEKRLVSIGQLVKAQTPVMMVVRVDPLKVSGEIPEHLAPWIKVGQPVTLGVDAYGDKTFTGSISRISPTVNTQTRAFAFEALVPNKDALLKPGSFARVRIETAKVDQVLTLPYKVLQYRYGVNQSFLVKGDRLVARELKLGDRLGERIEILDGVKGGDTVAATDVDRLVDGQKVTVSR